MVSETHLKIAYRVVITLILVGFSMLCQPFSMALFSLGFPILMVGVVGFMILDHIPSKPPINQEN